MSRNKGEASFTLIEIVLAVSIIAFLILQVSTIQGSAVTFSDYGEKVTQASWLSKRVMSRVKYFWLSKPFKDLIVRNKKGVFKDYPDYSWELNIEEMKIPLEMLLNLGGGGNNAEESAEANPLSGIIKTAIKRTFGTEPPFLVANVKVSWVAGAKRDYTTMTYILTNQKKLDAALLQLKPIYDQLQKSNKPKPTSKSKPVRTGKSGSADKSVNSNKAN